MKSSKTHSGLKIVKKCNITRKYQYLLNNSLKSKFFLRFLCFKSCFTRKKFFKNLSFEENWIFYFILNYFTFGEAKEWIQQLWSWWERSKNSIFRLTECMVWFLWKLYISSLATKISFPFLKNTRWCLWHLYTYIVI